MILDGSEKSVKLVTQSYDPFDVTRKKFPFFYVHMRFEANGEENFSLNPIASTRKHKNMILAKFIYK